MRCIQKTLLSLFLSTTLFMAAPAQACTRVVYQGPAGRILTGRSMDWKLEILSNLWIFPRGMVRDGAAGPNSMRWTGFVA